jgi:diguanylate cyclase (GGDEF)-like protein/PAS domain S-box-containing protein
MFIRVFFYLSFFISCSFISCQIEAKDQGYVSLTEKEQRWLAAHEDVIVGGSPDWKPFNFIDQQGNPQGINHDHLKLVSKYTGLKYRVIADEWQHNLDKIKNNEIHILGNVFKTEEREAYLDFSTPYFESLDYFFIRDDLDVNSFADLDGKRVAIPKGFAYANTIKQHFPNIIIIDVNTFSAAIDAVLENKADMLFDTYSVLTYTLASKNITSIIPFKSTRHLGKNPLHIVVNKAHPELASIIQKGLDAISPLQYRNIYNKWFKSVLSVKLLRLTAQENKWIANNPIINVAGDINFPPIDFVNMEGEHMGITPDFLKLIASKVGLELNFNITNWHQALESTKQQKNDLLPAIYQNAERDKDFIFSKEYFRSIDYFFAKNTLDTTSNPLFKGLKLAMIADHAAEPILKANYPELDIVTTNDITDAIDLLLANKVDLIFDSVDAVKYLLRSNGIVDIKIIKPIDGVENFAFKMATTKNNIELISIINKGIDAITPAEKKVIFDTWSVTQQGNDPLMQHDRFELSRKQKKWIDEHKVINVAGDFGWAPIEFRNKQGLYDGLGHDLLITIAKLTGLTFSYSTQIWEKSYLQVKNKQKDLLVATFKTEERKKDLLFSQPYTQLLNYFFIRNNMNITKIEDLNGLRLAITRNSAMASDIKKMLPKVRFVYFDSSQQAIDFIIEDKADALYDSHAVINYHLNKKRVTNIIPFKTLPKSPIKSLHVAVRNDYQPLIGIINKALTHIESTELKTLLTKWVVKAALIDKPRVLLTKIEKEWLQKHNHFTFVADPRWMPYESIDQQNKHKGIIPAYLDIIADTLNISFELIPTQSWQESSDNFLNNKVNMISASSSYTPLKHISMTNSYIKSPFVFIMRNQDKYIDDISQVLQKRITLINDYASTDSLITKFPDKPFQLVNSAEQGLKELSFGKTDVFIAPLTQVNYLIAEQGYNGLKVVGQTEYSLDISFVLQPELKMLVPIFNKVIASISTGEKQKILDKWGDKDILVKIDYQLIMLIIAIASIIILVIVIWNRRLQQEISLKASTELKFANEELAFQNQEKDKRAAELILANEEIDKRANELTLAASVFTHSLECIIITDASTTIIDVNHTFTDITGYSREESIGQTTRFFQTNCNPPKFYSAMWQIIKTTGQWIGEVFNRRKNGEKYVARLSIIAVKNGVGEVSHYVGLFSDISVQRKHQSQLEQMAHYDVLTKLPNRALLADRLDQAISQCKRHHHSLAVAFMDLDGFKDINDTYGHAVGDELLIIVSQRMSDALRDVDTIARIGGDEFVVVLTDLANAEDYKKLLDRLLLAVSEPITLNSVLLEVTASIGVTLYPQDDAEADILMRHADQSMYLAKQAGKNCYHLFDSAHDDEVNIKQESIDNIQEALDREEFVLYYQPKVNISTGKVVGAEALIRWQHPIDGLIPPLDFLPLIENHPISLDIGEWVIDTTLSQISQWQSVGITLPISVNISAYHLQKADFVERLAALLAAYSYVSPHLLELEVLETSGFHDINSIIATMKACIDLGVKFALDDFGTGYSSLTYLKRLPASMIKIDQSFIRDMLTDADDLAIILGVISLAKAFQLEVIAEGVETIEHGTALLQMGCEIAQGYGIARPMPANDMPTWLEVWKHDRALLS